jgi:hypothetical protein
MKKYIVLFIFVLTAVSLIALKEPTRLYMDLGLGAGAFTYYRGDFDKDVNLLAVGNYNEIGGRLGFALNDNRLYLALAYNQFNNFQRVHVDDYDGPVTEDYKFTQNYMGAGVIYYPWRQIQFGASVGAMWGDKDYASFSTSGVSSAEVTPAFNITLAHDLFRHYNHSFLIGIRYYDEIIFRQWDSKFGGFVKYRFRGLPKRPTRERTPRPVRLATPLPAIPIPYADTVLPMPPSNYTEEFAGTEQNPYLIANISNLRWLSENPNMWNQGKHFNQTGNIDASDTINWNNGQGFIPIGLFSTTDSNISVNSFKGVYDGYIYTIDNLYINTATTNEVQKGAGLFGFAVNANIRNINLTNVNITGESYTGAIVGHAYESNINNVASSGTITGNVESIGGLIGCMQFSTLENSHSSAIIIVPSTVNQPNVGGLVGNFMSRSVLRNSYFSGSIRNEYVGLTVVGGIVGRAYRANEIRFVYATGSENFVNSSAIAGFVGNTNVRNSVWDIETTGTQNGILHDVGRISQTIGLTSEQMKDQSSYTGWDFNTIWQIDRNINNGYPTIRK